MKPRDVSSKWVKLRPWCYTERRQPTRAAAKIKAIAQGVGEGPKPPRSVMPVITRTVECGCGCLGYLHRSYCVRVESVLDDPAAMARATEALQVSADMPHDERAAYIVGVALGEREL